MNWFQFLTEAGVMATILALGVALAAYFNGRHIKKGIIEIGKMIEEMRRDTKESIENEGRITREMMERSSKETREMLERMDQRAEEGRKEAREILERMEQRAEERHREVLLTKGASRKKEKKA